MKKSVDAHAHGSGFMNNPNYSKLLLPKLHTGALSYIGIPVIWHLQSQTLMSSYVHARSLRNTLGSMRGSTTVLELLWSQEAKLTYWPAQLHAIIAPGEAVHQDTFALPLLHHRLAVPKWWQEMRPCCPVGLRHMS